MKNNICKEYKIDIEDFKVINGDIHNNLLTKPNHFGSNWNNCYIFEKKLDSGVWKFSFTLEEFNDNDPSGFSLAFINGDNQETSLN